MEIKEIQVSKVYANWFQPRKTFDKEKLKELSESILSNGLINPITVKEWRDGKYLIVSGERRWRSHKLAKINTIQAVVKEYKDDGQFMIDSLIENIHREDLGSMEKAIFIKKIWKKLGKPTPGVLSNKLSMHENNIREHLALVDKKTPKAVQKAVEKGKLAMRSASMISQLPEKEQVAIAEEEIAPKIKEYIDKSGYNKLTAAVRLGVSNTYIHTMIVQLADLNKDEKDIIKLWRETKGEKGIAPSNLAEAKQIHPEKVKELIEIAKEEGIKQAKRRSSKKRLFDISF